MSIRRASLILPCQRLDDFPTHLSGQAAAELLAAWTVLWHPALLSATGQLPGWHPADNPPEPDSLDGELIIIPAHSAGRLPSHWQDRVPDPTGVGPPPVTAVASRAETLNAALTAAGIDSQYANPVLMHDFLALGYAYLQVELLTRAMHYSPVLDSAQFAAAVLAAAGASLAGDETSTRDELGRAFDLLMDARNHVYSVDFYVIDVTLLAANTLGEALQKKLASGLPTNLLAAGELIEQMASDEPQTLSELRRAVAADTACVFGGLWHDSPAGGQPPEAILAELLAGRESSLRHVGRASDIFGQFGAAYSPLLPEILLNCGFRAALHASFDGGSLPRAEQRKTLWGPRGGPQIEALSATPLDTSLPETWLTLARQAADSITHDHVATVLLAGWPGQACEYYEDLRRISSYGPLIGKVVTLEDYFRNTRKVDDWLSFDPQEYSAVPGPNSSADSISSRAARYQLLASESFDRLETGLARVVMPAKEPGQRMESSTNIVLNPWNFATVKFAGFDPLAAARPCDGDAASVPDVPGFGYAVVDNAGASAPPVPLAAGRTLRNERLEVVISESAGGIQSIRGHRDRRTRVSQRIVMHDPRAAARWKTSDDDGPPRLETQMVADEIAITRSDAVAGEITSQGRLFDDDGALLARFKQTVRLPRWLAAVVVEVDVTLERRSDGGAGEQYYASRLAWGDDALGVRRGVNWVSRPTRRQQIVSPEWVEITDGAGRITCFACGLPFHRLVSATWLDTLLVTAKEEGTRFQFGIGLDCEHPAQMALALLTAGRRSVCQWPGTLPAPLGWFLHIGAKNVIATHLEPLPEERPGIRMRLLETEGRYVRTMLSAFRPFRDAQATDFLGEPTEVLSVVDGQVRLEIGPHRWLQVEAEW